MRYPFRFGLSVAVALGLSATGAAAQQSVPSCYRASGLPVAPPPLGRSVFVFVDQTTPLTADLLRTIRNGLTELLTPGTSFSIARFSALSQLHHTRIVSSGTIEGPVPARVRPTLSVNRLNALDRCLARQHVYARRLAGQGLNSATNVSPAVFSRSEIMGSLAHLSEAVRAAPGRERIVILASDLLEHSSASSFYSNRGLRVLSPAAEIQKARRLSLLGNYARARVYVVGTAVLPPGAGASERPIEALNSLISFWTQWFRLSNASSVVVGRPNLVAPIR